MEKEEIPEERPRCGLCRALEHDHRHNIPWCKEHEMQVRYDRDACNLFKDWRE